jgi:hypothetical protein
MAPRNNFGIELATKQKPKMVIGWKKQKQIIF